MTHIETKAIVELLNKNWMTHDAMWFLHSAKECGMETTNRINKAAVRAMGAIEAKRLKSALGWETIESQEDFKIFFDQVADLVMPDFMRFTYTYSDEGIFQAEWQKCFAYEGMKKTGLIDQYECGIFARIEAWFDALEIGYTVSPYVQGCMMHTEGRCRREYKLLLKRT